MRLKGVQARIYVQPEHIIIIGDRLQKSSVGTLEGKGKKKKKQKKKKKKKRLLRPLRRGLVRAKVVTASLPKSNFNEMGPKVANVRGKARKSIIFP